MGSRSLLGTRTVFKMLVFDSDSKSLLYYCLSDHRSVFFLSTTENSDVCAGLGSYSLKPNATA